jgi:hypothetical protein
MSQITIVSSYYKLKYSKHNSKDYLQWMKNFFMIKTPKIIFTNLETYNIYFRNNSDVNRDDVFFYLLEWNQFKSWKYIDFFKKHLILDPERKLHNVNLYLLWNEKSSFLEKSIKLNKYQSSYYVYCDIGCFRINSLMKYYINWPNINVLNKLDSKKITLLNIENFDDQDFILDKKNKLPNSFVRKNRIGGGIICSHKDIFHIWYTKYYEILEKFILIDRFIGKDQSIMATIYILNQDLINLVKPRVAIESEFCQEDWFYLEPYLQGLF